MKQKIYRVPEISQRYGIGEATVYREVSLGRLRTLNGHPKILITSAAAKRWNEERQKPKKRKRHCRRPKQVLGRKRTFSLGGYFKLFIRKWR